MILLDAGHGGIHPEFGYTTAPNKMFRHVINDKVHTFNEGEWNRIYVKHLIGLIALHNQINPTRLIEFREIHHPYKDTPLSERALLVNEIVKEQNTKRVYRNKTSESCLLISFHFNASPRHNATGFEIFTSKGKTYSDEVATQYYNEFLENSYLKEYGMKWRGDWSDGDPDKEENFFMLKKTNCPSVLVEHGFFDNKQEYQFLVKDKTVIEFSHIHLSVIKWFYEQNKLWKHYEGR
jgi:N-acetylmuramoyl-L-alanine amidase